MCSWNRSQFQLEKGQSQSSRVSGPDSGPETSPDSSAVTSREYRAVSSPDFCRDYSKELPRESCRDLSGEDVPNLVEKEWRFLSPDGRIRVKRESNERRNRHGEKLPEEGIGIK